MSKKTHYNHEWEDHGKFPEFARCESVPLCVNFVMLHYNWATWALQLCENI